MRVISFTDLRSNARAIFDAVELGETFDISRRGKTVAQIRPVRSEPNPRWVNRPKGVRLKGGVSASQMLIKQRREAKY